jgi:hypothetical protein
MSERFCSLIILGPGAPRTFKLHLSRGAIAILVFVFVASFLAAAWVSFTLPPKVNASRHSNLQSENRALRVEMTNATIGIERLDAKVSALETQSDRINDLMLAH